MRRSLLALLLLVAGVPGAIARDAVSAIDACIRELDPGLDVGYERIAMRCPDLIPSLTTSPAAAWLPPDWNKSRNELSAGGLAELRTLLTRDVSGAAPARPLHVEHVAALLAALSADEAPRGGWWTRFKRWLRELFTPRPQRNGGGWLRRLFGDAAVPQAVVEAIVWGALGLVLVLAGAIVVNELRVAGWLRPLRRRSAPAFESGATGARFATSQEVEQAGLLQQPRLLLELIAARLAEQDRLPPARALTVRELARAARLPDAADRTRLEALGGACERVRFSDREIPPPALAGALAQGRELLAALQAPVQRAQGA